MQRHLYVQRYPSTFQKIRSCPQNKVVNGGTARGVRKIGKTRTRHVWFIVRYTPILPQAIQSPSVASSTPMHRLLFAQTFFFLQRFLLQLLLPTFEVTSRPFRPSVISRRIGGSKPGRTLLPARERERKSPGAFESSGCTSTSYRRTECSRGG